MKLHLLKTALFLLLGPALAFLFSQPVLAAADLCVPVGWCTQNGGTTGGGNSAPVTVTTLANLQSQVSGTAAKVIIVQGTMGAGVGTRVVIGSNKTVFGLPGATLVGGFDIKNASNVILRNMKVQGPGAIDVDGVDCVTVQNSTNVWIDHLDIWDGQDGNLDVVNGSSWVSITWTKFHYTGASTNHMFCNLLGNSDSATSDRGRIKVTLQSDWWADGVLERMPRVRFGQVHVVNNLFSSAGDNQCVRAGLEADLLVESNVFTGVKLPIDLYNNDFTAVTARNNIFTNCTGNTAGSGTAFTPPYTLNISPANQVEAEVRSKAGATLTSMVCGANPPTSTRTNTPVPPTATRTSTSTSTRTSTATASRTNTPMPATSTSTPTRTGTATSTRTNTAIPATATSTLTATRTATLSSTPTRTNTSVPATATFTQTSSMTLTRTATASSTASRTATPSSTSTNSPMANTSTATQTSSRTQTPTSTGSPSSTASSSMTPTASLTVTRTGTATSSPSSTSTSVPPTLTPTLTVTSSATASFTGTQPPTASSTQTPTASQTSSATSTLTASPSRTNTLVSTATPTSTLANTSTATASATLTATQTATHTMTLSATPSKTATPSSTSTLINTATASPTSTRTSSATPTPTATPTFTATSSSTVTATPSATPSLTPSSTSTPLAGPIPILSTNPANGDPIQVLPQDFTGVSPITVRIFTEKFLLVQTKAYGTMPLGWVTLELTDFKGQPLSNGIYYVVVETKNGRATAKLLILR